MKLFLLKFTTLGTRNEAICFKFVIIDMENFGQSIWLNPNWRIFSAMGAQTFESSCSCICEWYDALAFLELTFEFTKSPNYCVLFYTDGFLGI